eukprot:gene19966-26676_t
MPSMNSILTGDDDNGDVPCPSGQGYNKVDINPDNNMELPALFWDTMPTDADEHPDMIAMNALSEDETPEERADNFKTQGNNKLKQGLKVDNKVLLREAITFYGKGIALRCSDMKINSQLFSNRSHVQGLLCNWGKSLDDALIAQKADASNIKSYFRGAKAAMKLKRWERSLHQCEEGKKLDPEAPEWDKLLKECAVEKAKDDEKERKLKAGQEAQLAPARALVEAISREGVKMTGPQITLPDRSRPFLGEAGELHWPVVLMYPGGGMQQDVVQDFCMDECFADHLDVMFADDAPPLEFDTRKEYSRQRVEVYYLSYAGKVLNNDQLLQAMQGRWPEDFTDSGPTRFGEKASKWKRVEEALTLGEVMQRPDYVCPGLPVFFVVAADTVYRKRFLDWGNK